MTHFVTQSSMRNLVRISFMLAFKTGGHMAQEYELFVKNKLRNREFTHWIETSSIEEKTSLF